MHATRCAFASPKVSLEVTLHPPPRVGLACWQHQAKGCNNNSLQFSFLDFQIPTLISEDVSSKKTGGLDGGSEEEAQGARTIVCGGPADFI